MVNARNSKTVVFFDNPQDIIGRRFGKLVVVAFVEKMAHQGIYDYRYLCRCDCGAEVVKIRVNLVTGHTASCGCLRRRKAADNPGWTGHGEISGRVWGHIRAHALSRGLEFSLTIEEAWEVYVSQGGRCALTNLPLSLKNDKHKAPNAETASLDRIDNSRDYVPGNVQWLHKRINWMKGVFPQTEFVEWCCLVANHAGNRPR